MMILKTTFLAALLLLVSAAISAQDDPPLGVRLSLGEGKTSYRSGEPITLVLTFKAHVEGYSVSVGQEISDTVQDEVTVSPAKGVFEWKKQYMRGASYTSDAISLAPLNDGPVRIELPLNHFVRFDAAGRYTVRVRTKRIWLGHSHPIIELITNDVSFDVTMMTEAEEYAEVMRLASALDKANGEHEQNRIMTQLSYLTGNAAIPEIVNRFLTPAESGNYYHAARFGLFMAKDRALVIKMLENVFRDVSRPVSFDLLGVLSSLRVMHEVPVPLKPVNRTPGSFWYEEEPGERRIRDTYLKEIVDSLPKRKGKNLNETAFLILQKLPRKDPPADVLAKVRGILIGHFDELTMIGHEMLLTSYWDIIRDPLLIPNLERVFKNQTYPEYYRPIMRSRALRRLAELDPVRARPFLIAEIRDPESILEDDTVNSLERKQLPEVDEALVQQIRRFGSAERANIDMVRLRLRCLLAGRFATRAAYDELLAIYRSNLDKWQGDSRAFLLGYFSRFDPQLALELLETELTRANEGMSASFLNYMTRVHYAPELTPFLERRLASDIYDVASSGAYILSQHGPPSSRAKIEARLGRWLARWRNREFELEGVQMKPVDEGQAMLQVVLIQALRDGKNWKLTETELKDLIAECKTERCDQNFRGYKYAAGE